MYIRISKSIDIGLIWIPIGHCGNGETKCILTLGNGGLQLAGIGIYIGKVP
jgi:hypothetical protein